MNIEFPSYYQKQKQNIYRYDALQFVFLICLKEFKGTFEIKIGYVNHFRENKNISNATFALTVFAGIKNTKELQEKVYETIRTYQLQEIAQLRKLFEGNHVLQQQIDLLILSVDK